MCSSDLALYKREGLPWIGLDLPDSTPVTNCIGSVFKTLDEYSQQLAKSVGNASDENFCQKMVQEAQKDPSRKDILKQLKMSGGKRASVASGPGVDGGFTIKHYAGVVEYNTKGWLDKNNDRLLPECEALICDSELSLVQSLGEEDASGKALFRSISKKYVQDLQSLLETLSTCNLHYIRCFKPNAAFFEAHGSAGLEALKRVIAKVHAVGGLAALALVVILCKRCYRRCRRGGGTYNYERVCHELDREELDFKRALESQCDLEAGGDAQFDDAELERLYGTASVVVQVDGQLKTGRDLLVEIGRASCRERV